MTFALNTRIARCIVGNHATADSALRNMIRLQMPETGAGVMGPELADRVRGMLDGPSAATVQAICAEIFRGVFGQIMEAPGGMLVAAPALSLTQYQAGHRLTPRHRAGWLMQGHSAFVAMCAAASGEPGGAAIAERIVAGLIAQQAQSDIQRIPGLWHAGEREAVWSRGIGGSEWWRWVEHTYPFEDGTQAWNAVALHAFGYRSAFERALGGMSVVARVNGGLIPYNASVRSGRAEYGRFAVLFSTEEMARVAMLLRDAVAWLSAGGVSTSSTMEYTRAAEAIEGRLKDLELRDVATGAPLRRWPGFVDEWGSAVYPMADPADATRIKQLGSGVLTRDRTLSVRAGYDEETGFPAQAV